MSDVWLDRRDCENDDFPEVCLKCGRPATRAVPKTFSWMPGWVYVTLLVHLLVFIIVAAVTRKTLKARVPMCEEHRNHWLYRLLIILGSIPLLIAGMVGLGIAASSMGPNSGEPLMIFGILGSIVLWVITAIVLSLTAIRPTKISERGVKLTGVSQAFVDAYEGHQRQFQPHLPDLDHLIAERWAEGGGGPRRKEEPGRYQREEGDQERRGREKYSEDY